MSEIYEEPTVVQTDEGASDGQTKCPKCGATDISLNAKKGVLRCNFCRHEFEPEKTEGWEEDISKLSGDIIGSGAQDISGDTGDIVTLKCSSCGAEVVIDTKESAQARCHWCRNVLSKNEQIPNGAIPDVVLPFSLSRAEAREHIDKFVGKRKFFAHPKFKNEFCADNVMGVYMPYMIVDVNAHASFAGEGEVEINKYTIEHGEGDDKTEETYYDADLYRVERDFDITVEGLTVESNSERRERSGNKTNNIINSIMPFDTENCVKWDANYLRGYSSEKRDTNIEGLRGVVETQSADVARFEAHKTLGKYNRGVRWDREQFDVKGTQWKTAYLPVWLYSYRQQKGNDSLLHYVAVNARTKETMGSVPLHLPKLWLFTLLVELASFLGALIVNNVLGTELGWLLLVIGIIYFAVNYSYYRNTGARHSHESETLRSIGEVQCIDEYIKTKKRLKNSDMDGANSTRVNG